MKYTIKQDERFRNAHYFCVDGAEIRAPAFHQFQLEACHAMNHFESLRALLVKAGEQLVRSNYAGGLLSEIDKALQDSKA